MREYSKLLTKKKAYERLLAEFNIVLGTPLEETQKKLDKRLKRYLEAQKAKIVQKSEPQKNEIEPDEIDEGSLETETI